MVGRSHTYDLLSYGRASAKAGEKQDARRYLERLLELSPPADERLEALYWLCEVSDDPAEQRRCLEEILANNLGDARARRKLAILDGKLNPEEIVDPDRIETIAAATTVPGQAKAFNCPQCGARMVYTPDGTALMCEHCQTRDHVGAGAQSAGDDFIVAMATAKAQRTPLVVRSITCRGCGAVFFLPPHIITHTCPYCATPYALEQIEQRELDTPDSLLPFTVDENGARTALRQWFKQNPRANPRVAQGRGIYLPAWIFTIGGQIDWSGKIYRHKKQTSVSGSRIVSEENLLVPATRRLPDSLTQVFAQFDLSRLQPFDLRYLANWLAETFSVSAADAALEARAQAQKRLENKIRPEEIDQPVQDFRLRTANMLVESYRLALLPVWLTRYTLGGDPERHEILVNGQTGTVLAE
jgi:tetratricopeptide (TPR) repeat protein